MSLCFFHSAFFTLLRMHPPQGVFTAVAAQLSGLLREGARNEVSVPMNVAQVSELR